MNTLGKPVNDVIKIHYGQKLHRVITAPLINDPALKDYFTPNSLNYAAIETLEVIEIRPNESKTGLMISGMLINKKGEPLDPNKMKKNFVEGIEIPFDQSNVAVQPGVWFDEEKTSQLYAKDINSKSKAAVKRIQQNLEKYDGELDSFIKLGV